MTPAHRPSCAATRRAACIAAISIALASTAARAQGATEPRDGTESDTSAAPVEIRGFDYELETAYVQSSFAFGLNVRLHLFDLFSVGVRLSLDPDYWAIFTVPYFGITWPELGGFEIGALVRPTVTGWTVPYWESWRVWIGREKIFTLGASVLSNVPLNAVGYYDLGVGFGIGRSDDRLWFGLASIDDDRQAKGPAVKTQWEIAPDSWICAGGSYMIGAGRDGKRFSLSVGVKQEL